MSEAGARLGLGLRLGFGLGLGLWLEVPMCEASGHQSPSDKMRGGGATSVHLDVRWSASLDVLRAK